MKRKPKWCKHTGNQCIFCCDVKWITKEKDCMDNPMCPEYDCPHYRQPRKTKRTASKLTGGRE